MPFSPASRRASGVTKVPPEVFAGPKLRDGVRTSKNGSSWTGSAAIASLLRDSQRPWVPLARERPVRRRRGGGAFAAGAGAGALAAAPPSPAITATTAPTSAVSPACTLISASVPAVIDGTSIDTLSVSISNRLSPGFTASPADLNHFVILPSATVSPSCGIRTSIADRALSYQLTEMYCVSRNSFSPSCAPSRPMPDCFMPPNGAAGSETRPRFKPIMPKSSFSETRMPRPRSLV